MAFLTGFLLASQSKTLFPAAEALQNTFDEAKKKVRGKNEKGEPSLPESKTPSPIVTIAVQTLQTLISIDLIQTAIKRVFIPISSTLYTTKFLLFTGLSSFALDCIFPSDFKEMIDPYVSSFFKILPKICVIAFAIFLVINGSALIGGIALATSYFYLGQETGFVDETTSKIIEVVILPLQAIALFYSGSLIALGLSIEYLQEWVFTIYSFPCVKDKVNALFSRLLPDLPPELPAESPSQ